MKLNYDYFTIILFLILITFSSKIIGLNSVLKYSIISGFLLFGAYANYQVYSILEKRDRKQRFLQTLIPFCLFVLIFLYFIVARK